MHESNAPTHRGGDRTARNHHRYGCNRSRNRDPSEAKPHGHDNVTFKDTQYKSSGELNEMLGAGASADLLISASKGSMDTPSKRAMLTSPPARICS